ncbi:GumC family protein [Candidatus Binatia bacterium]|nr:GumC family protein [Candidatus Binatia bacterium]
MAHDNLRPDRPAVGRHGNVNTNGNGNSNANANQSGWGPGNWGPSGADQVRDILHVIFKHQRLIVVLFLLVAFPGVLVTFFKKPSFVASAKVMISTQRSDPLVQPTDMTRLDPVTINESLVNSEVHVLGSRDLVERVVRTLNAPNEGGGIAKAGSSRPNFGDQVLAMGRNLGITPIKNSNVIQIDYRSGDPMAATRIVNRVVDEYLAYHAQVHGHKGLPRFYDEQRRDLERRLRQAEASLVAFADAEGIVAPDEEISSSIRVVSELSGAMREMTANIAAGEEAVRVLRDQIAAQPEVVKRSQYLEINPVITQLGTQLVDRQVDRVTLLRKYTEKDRRVRDNAEEIAELQSQIDTEMRDRPTVVAHQLFRTNPLRESRLREVLDKESSIREWRARHAALDEELSRAKRRLVTLRIKSVDYDRLRQDVKAQRDAYELYVKREQEARISDAMDAQRLVNVDVVQRPALPLPKADSQRATVGLSLLAGLVVGIAGAFGREYLVRTLRSEYDVGRHLGLPMLASISETPRG